MEVKVTPAAIEAIKENLKGKDGNIGVRIKIAGIGWGGPTFGMALDEPLKSDDIYEVEGIKIIFNSELSLYTRGFVIDYRRSLFGSRFIVEQMYSSGRSCS